MFAAVAFFAYGTSPDILPTRRIAQEPRAETPFEGLGLVLANISHQQCSFQHAFHVLAMEIQDTAVCSVAREYSMLRVL
jgi:hypothetical protein